MSVKDLEGKTRKKESFEFAVQFKIALFLCLFQCRKNGPLLCVLYMLSCFSCVRLFAIPWTIALQAPLSMGFSRQEYWSGLPFSSPEDLPHRWVELASLKSPALAGGFFTKCATWEAQGYFYSLYYSNPVKRKAENSGNGLSDSVIQQRQYPKG